jgi:hypothetical protein
MSPPSGMGLLSDRAAGWQERGLKLYKPAPRPQVGTGRCFHSRCADDCEMENVCSLERMRLGLLKFIRREDVKNSETHRFCPLIYHPFSICGNSPPPASRSSHFAMVGSWNVFTHRWFGSDIRIAALGSAGHRCTWTSRNSCCVNRTFLLIIRFSPVCGFGV